MLRFIFRYFIYFTGLAILLVIFGLVYWVIVVRGSTPDSPNPVAFPEDSTPANRVRKITVYQDDQEGCVEITPDGLVRIYDTCGGEATDAYRSIDTRAVSRLFRLISEGKYSRTKKAGTREVIVETDEGVFTYYLDVETDSEAGGPGISDLIDDVIDDKPPELPTPTAEAPQLPKPSVMIIPSGSPAPSPTFYPGQPTPTPEEDKPFTCDFYDTSTGKRPYRVSNVVCSSFPEPGQ